MSIWSLYFVSFLIVQSLASSVQLPTTLEGVDALSGQPLPEHEEEGLLAELQREMMKPTENADNDIPPYPTYTNHQPCQPEQNPSTFSTLLSALSVMQSHYFHIWPGTWPTAIDWTATVMGTQISATLSAITDSLSITTSITPSAHNSNNIQDFETSSHENLINQYFTQLASFYHGENAFSLRTQAYDDMLWVVLSWLEAVKFINLHSELHYASTSTSTSSPLNQRVNTSIWYAQQFIPQFAHRARIFYDLASHGWDTTLCSGGMVWSPYLAPYKNAITNQLFIAASVGMYLYFPGDDNPSPFLSQDNDVDGPAKKRDSKYLDRAVEAYEWLKNSNMTNHQGLYTDGFHVSGWRGGRDGPNGTERCDLRDETVYTYNQGVILSGLRGLWDATSSVKYLQDGHTLIRNVITVTGWDNRESDDPWIKYRWAGLGRNGVMEDECDAGGRCSQNAHTFKGIWWHHFSIFCAPIVRKEGREWTPHEEEALVLHRKSCEEYGPWVKWNADAAVEARNGQGEYGAWWGRHPWWRDEEVLVNEQMKHEGTDYRNEGVPDDEVWQLFVDQSTSRPMIAGTRNSEQDQRVMQSREKTETWDPNDRGRGRTVETQSGGLAVVRALFRWEMWY